MAPKLWVLVEWVDESTVITSYGVVKMDIQLYNKTGLQPGQITLLRFKQDIRQAKILRIFESKKDVEEQRQILEHQNQKMQNVLQVCMKSIKEIKSANFLDVQQQTKNHSPIPEVLGVRNAYSDSSSDTEAPDRIKPFVSPLASSSESKSENLGRIVAFNQANVKINRTLYQKSTSKQTRSTLDANNLSRRSTNSILPLPYISAQEDINYTPLYKPQQSTSKQIRATLKENNLSRRSTNSSAPLPYISAQEDINYTPLYMYQQSTSKQLRATLKENKLSHRSTNSITSLPSTSAQEGIKTSCDNGAQTDNVLLSVSMLDNLDVNLRVVHQNLKYLLTGVNIMNWVDFTPMSETEPDKEASNIEQNVSEIEPNNKDNEEVGAKEVIDNNDNEKGGAEEVIDHNYSEKVDAEEVTENNDNEVVCTEEVMENDDNEEVGAEEVIENNDNEKIGEEDVMENNDNAEVDAEEVIENNDNEVVYAEEVIENNDNEEVGAEEVIENNGNEEVDAEGVIENNDNEEIGAEQVIENNDNEEVGAEEVIENNDNEEIGAEEVIENNGREQQVDSSTVNAEQAPIRPTLRVRRMSAQSTKDIKISMVSIGFGNTQVPESVLRDIDWTSYTQATRHLLKAVFPHSVLATHTLTGKPNPAFVDKPAKEMLDPTFVEDIVHTVVTRCRVTKKLVRTCISVKCAEEARAARLRKARMAQDEHDENISPHVSSSEE